MTWMCQCPREIADSVPVCGSCMMDRPTSTAPAHGSKCDQCHEPTRSMQLTPGDDRVERCSSCHFVYLKARAAHDPITADDFTKTRVLVGQLAERMGDLEATHPADATPGILERLDARDHPFPKRRMPRASGYFRGMRRD